MHAHAWVDTAAAALPAPWLEQNGTASPPPAFSLPPPLAVSPKSEPVAASILRTTPDPSSLLYRRSCSSVGLQGKEQCNLYAQQAWVHAVAGARLSSVGLQMQVHQVG